MVKLIVRMYQVQEVLQQVLLHQVHQVQVVGEQQGEIKMVNDHLQVFSKKQVGRFPNSSYEVIKTINDAIDERRLG